MISNSVLNTIELQSPEISRIGALANLPSSLKVLANMIWLFSSRSKHDAVDPGLIPGLDWKHSEDENFSY